MIVIQSISHKSIYIERLKTFNKQTKMFARSLIFDCVVILLWLPLGGDSRQGMTTTDTGQVLAWGR